MSRNNRTPQRRRVALGLGTAAGAFLAAGLIPLATSAVAHADDDGFLLGTDNDLTFGSSLNFGLFTELSFADPDDSFVGTVFQGPTVNGSPLFEDVLTSGADPSDTLSYLPAGAGDGVAGEVVNTFIVQGVPTLDSTFSLPLTDPLAELITSLLQSGL
jgi:hypothetical protein